MRIGRHLVRREILVPEMVRNLCLALAGALAGAAASPLTTQTSMSNTWTMVFSVSSVLLILVGSDSLRVLSGRWGHLRRRASTRPRIGVLSGADFGSDADSRGNVSKNWLRMIQSRFRMHYEPVNVSLLSVRDVFAPYDAIVNPFNSIYAEVDEGSQRTFRKILEYVRRGGIYVNTSDVPMHWAYNMRQSRRIATTTPVYDSATRKLVHAYGFSRLAKELSLDVQDVECCAAFQETAVNVVKRYGTYPPFIGPLAVQRAVVVDEAVDPVWIVPHRNENYTPLFWYPYGDGWFLISLPFIQQGDRRLPSLVLRTLFMDITGRAPGGKRPRR